MAAPEFGAHALATVRDNGYGAAVDHAYTSPTLDVVMISLVDASCKTDVHEGCESLATFIRVERPFMRKSKTRKSFEAAATTVRPSDENESPRISDAPCEYITIGAPPFMAMRASQTLMSPPEPAAATSCSTVPRVRLA
jgi:ribosomal protein L14